MPLTYDGWDFIACIPAIRLAHLVESGSTVALPSSDPNYQRIVQETTGLQKFLHSFTSSFGTPLEPTIIVRHPTAKPMTAVDLASFRNLIALSAIVKAKRDTWRSHQRPVGALCSDLFDIPPVNLARNGEEVSIVTAYEQGIHRLDKFRGQPSPGVVYSEHYKAEFDDQMLTALLALWSDSGAKGEMRRFRLKVLRSLELAYLALRAPFSNFGSIQDHGVMLSLWVSVFETLAHPGTQKVGFCHVATVIKSVPWATERLRRRRYRPIDKRQCSLTTLPVQIYGRLYKARNHYLHGDSLPENGIELCRRKSWGQLSVQVPLLFRSIVLHLLCKHGYGTFPMKPDWSVIFGGESPPDEFMTNWRNWDSQEMMEEPLWKAVPED